MADFSLVCMAPTEQQHLKMMRLLFLCLLLLLPAGTAFSEEIEGSGNGVESDDEDLTGKDFVPLQGGGRNSVVDKATGVDEASDQFTLIVIVVTVTVLTLSVAAVIAVMLARRHMHNRQQGIYSVPTEQEQKGAV